MPDLIEIYIPGTPGAPGAPGAPGDPGPGTVRTYTSISADTTLADADDEYWFVFTGATARTVTLPAPDAKNPVYHFTNRSTAASWTINCATLGGLVEDGNSLLIYPNESMDFAVVAGIWRVF